MALPPAKEDLYVPAELVNHCNFLRGEIMTVGGNPVFFFSDAVADKAQLLFCLVHFGSAEQNYGIMENDAARFDVVGA